MKKPCSRVRSLEVDNIAERREQRLESRIMKMEERKKEKVFLTQRDFIVRPRRTDRPKRGEARVQNRYNIPTRSEKRK